MTKTDKIRQWMAETPFNESGYDTKKSYRQSIAKIFDTTEEYVRLVERRTNAKMVLTKEVEYANGGKSTTHSLRDVTESEGGVLVGRTTSPNGGEWKRYKYEINWQDVFENLKQELRDISVPDVPKKSVSYTDHCAIINIYDAHLDKLVVRPKTGVGSLEDNIKQLDAKFEEILTDIEIYRPRKVIFPIGSDLFHTNWFNSKTKKGTELEYYCNPEIAYSKICKWLVQKIGQVSALTDDLVIVPIKGNHDQDKVVTLKVWLDVIYSESQTVTIENEIPLRQRVGYSYGRNLFGFGHGDKEKKMIAKIPLLMSQEMPHKWANSKRRHFYCGDLHHEFEYKFLASKDFVGCKVEFLRSAGVDDQYHVDNGWIGVPKSIYLDLWPKEIGRKTRIEYEF